MSIEDEIRESIDRYEIRKNKNASKGCRYVAWGLVFASLLFLGIRTGPDLVRDLKKEWSLRKIFPQQYEMSKQVYEPVVRRETLSSIKTGLPSAVPEQKIVSEQFASKPPKILEEKVLLFSNSFSPQFYETSIRGYVSEVRKYAREIGVTTCTIDEGVYFHIVFWYAIKGENRNYNLYLTNVVAGLSNRMAAVNSSGNIESCDHIYSAGLNGLEPSRTGDEEKAIKGFLTERERVENIKGKDYLVKITPRNVSLATYLACPDFNPNIHKFRLNSISLGVELYSITKKVVPANE